ncbi:hypothetical protein [Mesorhizobium sp. M7A.F.Ca.US.008.03.1.1]|uniref:hypothetical protein n=1 Tax=Mesorhizobium sp. M7A.F.Ca.US.008.03.1.1 TaxID=2496742 RepID=UPI000FCB1305|nr:hypothetical protein [Mesorhizobium sp. M7A.F.Ca.US.008.03.1.1]RUW62871.1 hypothetical protein EOA16_07300 [Mesorhizobium sp. M7A.F.Ca.US.008.03.1.1]
MSQRMFQTAFRNSQIEYPREKGPSIYDIVSAEVGNRHQMKSWARPWEVQFQALIKICEENIDTNGKVAMESLWAAIHVYNDAGRNGLIPGWVEPTSD